MQTAWSISVVPPARFRCFVRWRMSTVSRWSTAVSAMPSRFLKNVIILTRNKGYRKEEKDFWLPGFIYRRYPAIRKQLKLRYRNYNEVLDYIDELEAKGDAIVIRPQKKMEVGRTTNDRKKLSALYDEGYAVGRSIVENNRFDFKTPVI